MEMENTLLFITVVTMVFVYVVVILTLKLHKTSMRVNREYVKRMHDIDEYGNKILSDSILEINNIREDITKMFDLMNGHTNKITIQCTVDSDKECVLTRGGDTGDVRKCDEVN